MAISFESVRTVFAVAVWVIGFIVLMVLLAGCGPVHLHVGGDYYGQYDIPRRGNPTSTSGESPEKIAQELIDGEINSGTETGQDDE
jgi:hypothetical protein